MDVTVYLILYQSHLISSVSLSLSLSQCCFLYLSFFVLIFLPLYMSLYLFLFICLFPCLCFSLSLFEVTLNLIYIYSFISLCEN